MLVNFDDKQYSVDDDTLGFMVSKLRNTIVEGYAGINETYKFMLKTITRKILYGFEEKYGSKMLDYPLRPSKGDDPTIHMIDLTLHLLRTAADHATVTVKSENTSSGTRTITSFSISDPN